MSEEKKPVEATVLIRIPRGTVPMPEEGKEPPVPMTFTDLDEVGVLGRRLLHMTRIIARSGRQEAATLVLGFLPRESSSIALGVSDTVRLVMPTVEEREIIEHDLKMLYHRPVVFYKP